MIGSFIGERRSEYAGSWTRELVVAGNGPAIVLVHGFGHAADAWRPVLDLMYEAGQTAVAVDLPGFGHADPLADGELLPQLDEFLAAVIRHYGNSKGVVLVGNSLGAAAALRAARNKELPIAAIMPLGVAGIAWNRLTASVNVLATWLQVLSAVPVPRVVHRIVLRWTLSRWLYGERSAVDPQVVEGLIEIIPDLKTTGRLVQLGAKFKEELDRTRDHGGIGVQMTVIHGARDRLVPVSASRILHEANPGSRLIVLERAGHCPQLDAAHVIVRRARELARVSTDWKEIS
jgi:pimeloyl-ACP methyl ester carboxylesterase